MTAKTNTARLEETVGRVPIDIIAPPAETSSRSRPAHYRVVETRNVPTTTERRPDESWSQASQQEAKAFEDTINPELSRTNSQMRFETMKEELRGPFQVGAKYEKTLKHIYIRR